MHIFNYSFLKDDLLPAQLVTLAANISALKVMTSIRQKDNKVAFRQLESIAKIESVKASNAIEGIVTTDERIRALVGGSSAPLNHTEAEIAGYRDALNEIHVNYAAHDFRESDIRNLHAQMMRLAEPSADGAYKTDDNVIAERMPDGRRVVRFQPTSAADTPEAMRQLVLAYVEARDDAAVNKLLLIPCVVLDFLCVHPFRDGNGRLSRLLTLLLLYRNGFDAGKYISFTPWTVAHKFPLSMGFSQQDYSHFPLLQGISPDPGMEPTSPTLARGFFATDPPRKPDTIVHFSNWQDLIPNSNVLPLWIPSYSHFLAYVST